MIKMDTIVSPVIILLGGLTPFLLFISRWTRNSFVKDERTEKTKKRFYYRLRKRQL